MADIRYKDRELDCYEAVSQVHKGWVVDQFVAARDVEGILGLDTSFSSEFVYQVRYDDSAVHLELRRLREMRHNRFPLDLKADSWEHGFVAMLDGKIRGFIGMGFEKWNRRMSIWHFYVDLPFRRLGCGKLLMEAAMQWGSEVGALVAWVETTSINAPGVNAYKHLGFEICGFDSTLYCGTPNDGEVAVYLARQI